MIGKDEVAFIVAESIIIMGSIIAMTQFQPWFPLGFVSQLIFVVVALVSQQIIHRRG